MSRRTPAEATEVTESREDAAHVGMQFGAYLGEQQRSMMQNATEAFEQSWRFASDRMAATADYLHALRGCASAPDWVALNNGYFATAMDDFARHAEKFVSRTLGNGGGPQA